MEGGGGGGVVEQTHQQAEENHQPCNQTEEREESTLIVQQSRQPNLSSLQIPERSVENILSTFTRLDVPSPSSTRAGLPPRPSSAKFRSSMKNLLSQKSFRGKNESQDGEKTVLIIPDTLPSDKHSPPRSFSPNKVLSSSSTKSAHSLPVTPIANLVPERAQEKNLDGQCEFSLKPEVQRHMTRSFSVPVNVKIRSLRRMDSTGGLIRVITASPRPTVVDSALPDKAIETEIASEDAGEDIPEEEAVCRICFVELGEGGETLKMECSCKGELALAHRDCAVKWFSIKGNRTCDICKQDVRNLPVTLLKIHNPQTNIRRPVNMPQQREVTQYRHVHIISMPSIIKSTILFLCVKGKGEFIS
ncbi:unnamed protein product [Ilex paraguariensis]|uniref:RING-CH-type domain-containing protein n=1 Tax=Ilex paraguariensis TaxID=185542 RepID=A0ABC8U3Z4_9AQUA